MTIQYVTHWSVIGCVIIPVMSHVPLTVCGVIRAFVRCRRAFLT